MHVVCVIPLFKGHLPMTMLQGRYNQFVGWVKLQALDTSDVRMCSRNKCDVFSVRVNMIVAYTHSHFFLK